MTGTDTSHLKRYASLASAAGLEFEELCLQLFAELFEQEMTREPEASFSFEREKRRVVVACKSATRSLTEDHLHQLGVGRDGALRIVILNAYRELPVPDRPEVSPQIQEFAESYSIVLVTAPELLRLYTRWRLCEIDVRATVMSWQKYQNSDLHGWRPDESPGIRQRIRQSVAEVLTLLTFPEHWEEKLEDYEAGLSLGNVGH